MSCKNFRENIRKLFHFVTDIRSSQGGSEIFRNDLISKIFNLFALIKPYKNKSIARFFFFHGIQIEEVKKRGLTGFQVWKACLNLNHAHHLVLLRANKVLKNLKLKSLT